ncbi:MAG: Hint domain-containing protein [Mameliella sp.]|nr:Hint domain-containing protein [Mameliella sp.]
MPFSITKGIEYDVFDGGPGNFNFQPSPGTATDLGALGPFGGEGVDDSQFTVGEDISGSGTIYIGDIEIEGNLYPVITATGNYPIADGGNVFILVPDYLPEPSAFPASFDFNPDVVEETYSYCFAAGTRIATEAGETEVQDLAPGDLVRTADGRLEPVRWVGRQTIDRHFNAGFALVRINAGALGDGLPKRDLVLTGDHAMVLDGSLVNAGALVNGETITFVPVAQMAARTTVYHVETARHEVLLAEGAGSESFCDYAGRYKLDNHAEYLAACGAEHIIPEMDMPRISSARMLPAALRARLGLRDAA